MIRRKQQPMNVDLNHLEKHVLLLMSVFIRLQFCSWFLILKLPFYCLGFREVLVLEHLAFFVLRSFWLFLFLGLFLNGKKVLWIGLHS